jgi:hypothetical protein
VSDLTDLSSAIEAATLDVLAAQTADQAGSTVATKAAVKNAAVALGDILIPNGAVINAYLLSVPGSGYGPAYVLNNSIISAKDALATAQAANVPSPSTASQAAVNAAQANLAALIASAPNVIAIAWLGLAQNVYGVAMDEIGPTQDITNMREDSMISLESVSGLPLTDFTIGALVPVSAPPPPVTTAPGSTPANPGGTSNGTWETSPAGAKAQSGWNRFRDAVEITAPLMASRLNLITDDSEEVRPTLTLIQGGLSDTIDLLPEAADVAEVVTEVSLETELSIEALPEILFGAGILGGTYVVGWANQLVGGWFEEFSILGFHPLSWLGSGMQNMGVSIDHEASVVGDFIFNTVVAPVRAAIGLVERIVNVAEFLYDHISWIETKLIPTVATSGLNLVTSYVEQEVEKLDEGLTTYVDNSVKGAVDDLTKLVTSLQDDISTATTKAVDEMFKVLGDNPVITQLKSLAPEIAIGAAAAIGLNLATQTATEVDDCSVNTCDETSPNYYKNLIKDFLLGLSDVAILAYLKEAITDPVGFADTQAPTLEDVGGVTIDTLNAFLDL